MKKEIISSKQGICIITLFLIGSKLIIAGSLEAGKDAWISNTIGIMFAIPILMVYARILSLFPGQDLFKILQIVFGNIIGKIISLGFFWYSFSSSALVMRNLTEFINVTSLTETPQIINVIVMGLLCIWAVKEGIEVIGRWAEFLFPLIILLVISLISLSLGKIEIDNILPIMHNDFRTVLKEGYFSFSFPFTQTVIIMMIGYAFKKEDNKNKIFINGLLIGGIAIVIDVLRNILLMGEDFVKSTYFPSYSAIGLINIGKFLQRFEIIVAIIFVCGVFVKISVYLLAACKGLASIINIKEYRIFAFPIGLLMINLSLILFDSIIDMRYWIFNIHNLYVFPFQVFFPLIIWIGAEIKIKKANI